MLPKHLKLPLIILACLALLTVIAPVVQAADSPLLPVCVKEGYCTLCDILQVVINFGRFLLGIVGSLALLMFIYGGFTWLTSGGEPGKIDAGKKILINSVIGVAITFFAWVIVAFVVTTLTAGNASFKWDAELTCAKLPGLEPANLDPTRGGGATNTCLEAISTDCGTSYPDPVNPGTNCIGKKCDAGKSCQQTVTTPAWDCKTCLAKDAACTDADKDQCCSKICTNNKCADATTVTCKLGKTCDPAAAAGTALACEAGMICETNWSNTCGYGKIGISCSKDSECEQPNAYCFTGTGVGAIVTPNVCMVRAPFASCNGLDDNSCAPGYTCAKDTISYCTDDDYTKMGCKNQAILSFTPAIGWACVKNSTLTCACDCDSDADCSDAKLGESSAPKCAFNSGANASQNYCSPGTIGNECQNGTDCITGFCSTNNQNMCTNGAEGEGCGTSNAECKPGLKCFEHHCVISTFDKVDCGAPPPPDAGDPSGMIIGN